MISIPENMRFTKNHEWIKMEDEFTGVCGITDHVQERMGYIVFVELPDIEIDVELKIGGKAALIESFEDIRDVCSPVSGRIIAINRDIEEYPDLINKDPYGDGWLFKVDVKDLNELNDLMDSDLYDNYVLSGE